MQTKKYQLIELANAFSAVLNRWIPEKLFEVNLRNKEESYAGCCATHDFCDPNQAMIDAFMSIYGREPEADSDQDNELINAAWNLAKAAQFKPCTGELYNSIYPSVDLASYEQTNVWIDQVNRAAEAFNERTENGLLAIEMLIAELESIKAGQLIY